MKISGRVVAFAILIFLTSTAPIKAENWAILIGVNDYNEATDLRYCVADQLGLQQHLIECGFEDENIFMYKTGAKNPNRLPTHANIKKQIKIILNNLEKGDVVVFGFSGHGIRIGKEDYLCPSDADLKDLNSLVSLDYVYERLKASEASMKMLLIDACKNQIHIDNDGNAKTRDAVGFTKNSNAKAFALNKETVPKGIFMMSSCTAGQASYESPKFGHGVWMHFVLEGLRGKADANKDKKVTLVEIADYTNSKTFKYVFNEFNGEQKPWSEVSGENGAFEFNIADIKNYVPEDSFPAGGESNATVSKPKLSESFNAKMRSVMSASSIDERIDILDLVVKDRSRNEHEIKVAKEMRMTLLSVRAGSGDIEKAIQDAQAIGKKGVPVKTPKDLVLEYMGKDDKPIKTKISKGEVLLITKFKKYQGYPEGLFWAFHYDENDKENKGFVEPAQIGKIVVANEKPQSNPNQKGAPQSYDYEQYGGFDPLEGLTERDINYALKDANAELNDYKKEINRFGNGLSAREKALYNRAIEEERKLLKQQEAELKKELRRQKFQGGFGGGFFKGN